MHFQECVLWREGVDYYNKLGYVPYDVGINENAARTLEYAYADFTIAEMAKKMNKPEISKRFYKQSKNYKNTLINTLILLLSGTTVTWAHHAMLENDRKGLVRI